ncbi:hypothetical protein [Winogradskyella luteola]|nr:hypothetical protein [Winogradskyella luteola]
MAKERNRSQAPKPKTTQRSSGIVKGSVPTMRNPPPPPPKK